MSRGIPPTIAEHLPDRTPNISQMLLNVSSKCCLRGSDLPFRSQLCVGCLRGSKLVSQQKCEETLAPNWLGLSMRTSTVSEMAIIIAKQLVDDP